MIRTTALALLVVLLALPGAASAQAPTSYEVTLTNTAAKQALSPGVFATHRPDVAMFRVGQPASDGIRVVAEEGKTDPLASTLRGTAGVTAVQTTAEPIMPGRSMTVRITANPGDVLSVATMLVQTNDGFAGASGVPLSDTVALQTYDAGTEENNQLRTHVPGPPFMGMQRAPTTGTVQPHPGLTETGDVRPAEWGFSGSAASLTIRAAAAATAPAQLPRTGGPAAPLALLAGAGGLAALAGLWARRRGGSR